jgi:hypothetical protein
VLEGTAGKLVDAYKDYDRVTLPGRRDRAGCLAHVRRKFFDAQSAAPEAAKQAMDFIPEVYKFERAALDADLRPEWIGAARAGALALHGGGTRAPDSRLSTGPGVHSQRRAVSTSPLTTLFWLYNRMKLIILPAFGASTNQSTP